MTDAAQQQTMPSDLPAAYSSLKAGEDILGIIPRSIEEVWRLAGIYIAANMVPDSYSDKDESGQRVPNRGKVAIGIMKGLECGMGPVTALATIMIINNRACIWGDGAVALCQRSGSIEWMKKWTEGTWGSDDYKHVVEIKRRGQDVPYRGEFSIGDAKRAKLWGNTSKQPWILYPARMLFNRARAMPLRDGFADHLNGLGIAEEVQDMPPPVERKAETSFLDDAPRIEHKPEMPIMVRPDFGAPQAEPAAAETMPAASAAAPPDDWGPWAAGVCDEIDGVTTPPYLDELAERIKGTLESAPPVYAGQVNRRLRDKRAHLKKGAKND
jgi:hypothetical protein